jgi:tetratricopeptide (TPR) repeat protein
MSKQETGAKATPARKKYVPVVGPRLKRVLALVFALFAVIGVNSVYLASVTFAEWATGRTYQNYFYLTMFLLHLALGIALILPVIIFGVFHWINARNRPNRRAVAAGIALLTVSVIVLATGVLLTRVEGIIEINSAGARQFLYWTHVVGPLAVVWLFVLHRLAGRRIKWRIAMTWSAVAAVFAGAMVIWHSQDPRAWSVTGPASGEAYFFPSLARTSTGNFIPAETLMMDSYCLKCHEDSYAQWEHSAHRFSSFNNPVYLFSVRESREKMLERDGNVQGARFCAGCHDPAPFFSGAFDDPNFDDVNHPTAQAGITCTSCHAITNVNSVRGNADFTIEEPLHYPFTFSDNPMLKWVNEQLVKAKQSFHKKKFLKPLHQTAEFCSACHKVHIPQELNDYKFLRGQNHYDPFLLSGVSGHGASSFYYPPKSEANCNNCHMPLKPSEQFAAKTYPDQDGTQIHSHLFPSANTGIAALVGMPQSVIDEHMAFSEGTLRVDIFGVREGGTIDGELLAPIRPEIPALAVGRSYLVDVVLRTMDMGHTFTQGTTDSNEVWIEVEALLNGQVIGRSGAMDDEGFVDPWSHFVNVYMLDRNGDRIDRRNVQDIFTPLYNHQIPPGAADVLHYALRVPEGAAGELTVKVAAKYRKFDATLMQYVEGEDFDGNDLPIMTLSTDEVTFPLETAGLTVDAREIPEWMRWNDYGIGLFRKGSGGSSKGELRQAEVAFRQVEALDRPDGPLNLARVYLKEGRLDEAVESLNRAEAAGAPVWTRLWLTGEVNKQNGRLDEAIEAYRGVLTLDTTEMRERGFDFSKDYRVHVALGTALFERSRQERGEAGAAERRRMLNEAVAAFEGALALDPENLAAHYNLGLLYAELGDATKADVHKALHAEYKPDDNARDIAIAAARRKSPAANHAADDIVLYDLQRVGAFGLPTQETASNTHDGNTASESE